MDQELVQQWCGDLTNLRTRFSQAGFGIHVLHERTVDAMRERLKGEKGYVACRYEMLKEKIALNAKGLEWNLMNRSNLDSAWRSKYLDSLYENLISGAYDDQGVESSSRILVDPNEILFYKWALNDRQVLKKNCSGFYTSIDLEKKKEFERLKDVIDISVVSNEINSNSIVDLLTSMASRYELDIALLKKGKNARCVLRTRLASGLHLFLEWSNFEYLKLQGDLWLRFLVRDGGAVDWETKNSPPFFCADIDWLIPGAWYYLKTSGNRGLLLLGLLAHVNVLSLGALK